MTVTNQMVATKREILNTVRDDRGEARSYRSHSKEAQSYAEGAQQRIRPDL